VNPRENTGCENTGCAGHADPVSIAEIAEFVRDVRSLSRPTDPGRPGTDSGSERTAFLARKADLFARIAAQHPDLAPPTTAPPTTAPPTTQPDGGRA
jgi:hypothetical protein